MRRMTSTTPSEAERMPTGACQREGGIGQDGGVDSMGGQRGDR